MEGSHFISSCFLRWSEDTVKVFWYHILEIDNKALSSSLHPVHALFLGNGFHTLFLISWESVDNHVWTQMKGIHTGYHSSGLHNYSVFQAQVCTEFGDQKYKTVHREGNCPGLSWPFQFMAQSPKICHERSLISEPGVILNHHLVCLLNKQKSSLNIPDVFVSWLGTWFFFLLKQRWNMKLTIVIRNKQLTSNIAFLPSFAIWQLM